MKIAEVCVKRPVFAVMLVAFLVTLGIFSFRSLGVDLFPKVDPATVNVTVDLPGASPDEMVSSVVLPLEDAISSVSGIDEMMVRATEGTANITTNFKLERDIETATQDVTGEGIRGPEKPTAEYSSAGHYQGRSRFRSDSHRGCLRTDEPA